MGLLWLFEVTWVLWLSLIYAILFQSYGSELQNLKKMFLKSIFGPLLKVKDKIQNHIPKAESAQILKIHPSSKLVE